MTSVNTFWLKNDFYKFLSFSSVEKIIKIFAILWLLSSKIFFAIWFIHLLSISKLNETYGLAYLDISTSEFEVLEIRKEQLNSVISKISPREIIIEDLSLQNDFLEMKKDDIRISIVQRLDTEKAKLNILRHFKKEIEVRNNLDPIVQKKNNIPYLVDQHLLDKKNA